MTDNVNKKYERNRNNWRTVYSFHRRKPNVVSSIDPTTSQSFSYDLQKTIRNREFFILSKEEPFNLIPPPNIPPQYDEGVFNFPSISESGSGFFNFSFTSIPYVVLTIESASLYGPGINLFGRAVTTSSFTFGTSAPFTGSIRWRAIYSPSYPAYVSSAYTASITASAGQTSPGGNSYYTASFAALPEIPFTFLDTAWENIGIADGSSNAALTHNSTSNSSETVDISAPMNSTIDFIAFYDSVALSSSLLDDSGDRFVDENGSFIIYV